MVQKDFSEEAIKENIEEIISFIHDVANGYYRDHDEDAHKYGTICFVCRAEELKEKLKINIYWKGEE